MSIEKWLSDTTGQFRMAGIGSARLDAELILAHVLGKSREWLLAHNNEELTSQVLKQAQDDINRRIKREPLAYITGHKEFYGRSFMVTPDVLIPRPETEQLIKIVDRIHKKISRKVDLFETLDVGTGSGAIAITLALELPNAQVTASDISTSALKIARMNADDLGAKIKFIQADLLSNIQGKFNLITANLPYVDRTWPSSPEIKFEPEQALFASDGGQELIKKLIRQAPRHLKPNGYLLLELDPRQTRAIAEFARQQYFQIIGEYPFALELRCTTQPTEEE